MAWRRSNVIVHPCGFWNVGMVYISFGWLPSFLAWTMADFKRVGQHPVVVALDAANVRAKALELPESSAIHVALGEDNVARVDQGLDEDVVRLA